MRTPQTQKMDLLTSRTGLPRRYLDLKWDDVRVIGDTPEQRRRNGESLERVRGWVTAAEANLTAGRGLYLGGPLGVGKSMILTLIGREVLAVFKKMNAALRKKGEKNDGDLNGLRFVLTSRLTDLVYPPKDAMSPDGILRRELYSASALMMDDLTKLAESRMGGEVVFLDGVIRTRYHARLTTFYTSQVPLEGTDKLAGLGTTLKAKGIEDLIAETCDVVYFHGPSERRAARGG